MDTVSAILRVGANIYTTDILGITPLEYSQSILIYHSVT
jgi:hypothetical protein